VIGAYVVAFIKSALLTLVASACIPFILLALGITIPFFIKTRKKTVDLLEEGSSLSFEIFSSIRIVVAFWHRETTPRPLCLRNRLCRAEREEVWSTHGYDDSGDVFLYLRYNGFGILVWHLTICPSPPFQRGSDRSVSSLYRTFRMPNWRFPVSSSR